MSKIFLDSNVLIYLYDSNEIKKKEEIKNVYKYSFPDSLIVAAAVESGCDLLFSEDMHNEHVLENGLKILSPFK